MTNAKLNEPDSVRLSVVIPCYNEAKRIGTTLDAFQNYLKRQAYSSEILVVDDGSTDGTARHVEAEYPEVRVVAYESNSGKGRATKLGMEHACGEIRLISDADASTPLEEIEKFWPAFEAGASVVIGSRALPESDIEVRQPWYRENMGRIYNVLLRILRLTEFPDTQCGFKAYTAESCKIIFPRQRMKGFGADCECLYIAKKHGIKTVQIPIRWLNSPDTRVHALFDSLDMIREVLIVRFLAFLGKYD